MADDADLGFDDGLRAACASLIELARSLGITVGTAESCTGGLVSAALTAIPGSSAVVTGSVVSYAIDVKRSVLGVSDKVLDAPGVGAVSSECAAEMALGARRILGCDVAVSVTGIAGPGGEEPAKPIGTVWFGLSYGDVTTTQLCHFEGDRDTVRHKAVLFAVDLLCGALEDSLFHK